MGEIAALVTALCWALSSILFTAPSKALGAVVVNRIRLVFAVVLLMAAHLVVTGQLFPLDVSVERWFWLGLSGIVGLIIGDTLLFRAYALLGSRLSTLLMAIVPVLSSIEALLFLDEKLTLANVIGILICVGGISLVVLKHSNGNGNGGAHERRQFWIGVLCGLGGALGQASGLVLSKLGMAGDFPTISASVMRMFVAMIVIWLMTLLSGQARQTLRKISENRASLRNVAAASVIGPFVGVWLSQVAIQYAYVGIASTLMAMTPIIILPIARFYFKEKISPLAYVGTIIALVGVAVIFL
jgi:drug/metabolite transporter (DMT)-like permease